MATNTLDDTQPLDAVTTYRMTSRPTCDVCGAEDTPSGCVNDACENYNGCGW